MISMTKTYYTREGRQTRILCVDWKERDGERSVIALVSDKESRTETLILCYPNGMLEPDKTTPWDLIEQQHIPEMPRATPEHCIRLPDEGYDTTVGNLIGANKALRESCDDWEKRSKAAEEEVQQVAGVLEAVKRYLPPQSVPWLLAKAVLEGNSLSWS